MTDNPNPLRSTYAQTAALSYRLRAACAMLHLSENALRSYDNVVGVRRANEANPSSPAVRVYDIDTLFRIAAARRPSSPLKPPPNHPVIVAVGVIKGGTGKSTTAGELGLHLQLMGWRVLLIDLDAQANLTQMVGYEADLTLDEAAEYGLSADAIVADTFATAVIPYIERQRNKRSAAAPLAIKQPFGAAGPHLIPADTFIGDLEQALAAAKGQRELFFQQFFMASRQGEIPGLNISDYDAIILDCPPSVSFVSTNALAAADAVIAPIKMEAFSVKGLTKLMSELKALAETYRRQPQLTILPTHYSSNLTRVGRMQAQLAVYRDYLAPHVISASEEFPRSLDAYLPLSLQKPGSPAAGEYRIFAEYMAKRLLERASS